MSGLQVSTARVFAVLLLLYGLALLPALWSGAYLDSPAGVLVLLPFFSVYLLHAIGLPGLLVNNGACGWGWCAPTALGWGLAAALWVAVAWGVAWAIARTLVAWRQPPGRPPRG